MLTDTATLGFDEVLSRLARTPDEQLVHQLFKVYFRVGQMTGPEVIAAYHTVHTVRRINKSEKNVQLCEELEKAIVVRMNGLVYMLDDDDGEALVLIELFSKVTGVQFKRLRT